MTFRYPADIQNDIEYVDSEIKENQQELKKANWRRGVFGKKIASYTRMAAPIRLLEQEKETEERVEELETNIKALEAEKQSYEKELEQALSVKKDRYRLETGETLKPTEKNLKRLIEEGETQLAQGDSDSVRAADLSSYYKELAHAVVDQHNNEAVRYLKRAIEIDRQFRYEVDLKGTQSHLLNILMQCSNSLRYAGNYGQALDNLLEAREIASTINDLERESSYLTLLRKEFDRYV